MKIIIGIDIGTSGTKVLAIDENAKLLKSVTKEYPCYSPMPNWSEQNPSDWWTAVSEGLDEILSTIDIVNVASIGLSGQMHGMVALDSDFNFIRPAILWNDQRTKLQCNEIIDKIGGLSELLKCTNNSMLTGFTAGKILWMKENEPDNYRKTKVVINPKDYIAYKLTGKIYTDVSDASGTGLFDIKNCCWNKKLINASGFDISMFPEVKKSSDIIGYWNKIPVVIGGGDAVLSAISMGAGKDNQIAIMLGTSGVVAKHADSYFDNDMGKLQFSCACEDGKYHIMGVTLAAAGSYKWLSESLINESYYELDKLANESPVCSKGIIYLPYLFGERCPINDENASACFVGIKSDATKGDFARAVLEGVTFSLKQVFDLMNDNNANEIILAGGGSKSKLWCQIIADVFGMKVITVKGGSEGSGFGAAVVAGVGVGVFNDTKSAVCKLKANTETYPLSDNTEKYKMQYKKYCSIYNKLK